MNTILLWIVRLQALLATSAVLAQQPEWFAGKWDVSYRDAQLGEVKGMATVNVHHDGFIYISYLVTDPRDGSAHELIPFHIQIADNTVTMELPPGGPVAALDAEGRPLPAAPGGETITVPEGARLRATLAGSSTDAVVSGSPARLATRLRLVRDGDRLAGEWQVVRDPNAGFGGARSGTRGTVVNALPPPVGEVREEIVRGPETWLSARMVVEKAQRTGWRDAAAAGGIEVTADVSLTGRNLPEPRRREVRFADPYLRPDNTALTMTLPVGIASRAVPGPKTFILRDRENTQEAPGIWVFDWPALRVKDIHHARRTAGGVLEPTGTIFFGELFWVEIESDRDASGDLRLYCIESDAAAPVFFHVQRDAQQRTKYRAGPFLLLAPGEPAAAGAVAAPKLSANEVSVTAPGDTRPFIVRASSGSRIRTGPATAQPGDPVAMAFADAREDHSEDGPYQRALKQAEAMRRLYPEEDRYNISRFTPLSGSRRTLVTVQDHAALILLHAELLRNLDVLRRQHTRSLSANEKRALAGALMQASEKRVDLPVFYQQVLLPDGKTMTTLNVAVYPNNLREAFGNDTAKRDAYLDRVIEEAGRKLAGQAALGGVHLSQVDISRPESLLPSIKAGYESGVASLMPRLVRRARPANGEPAVPRWVVDETGRAAVRGVSDLLGAIAADEELADFQWGALQIMALPAAVYTSALGMAGVVTRGVVAAASAADALAGAGAVNNLVRLDAARDLRDAGWDAAPVAGYDAFRAANHEVFARSVTAAVDIAPIALSKAATIAGKLAKAGIRPTTQGARAAVTAALENGVDTLSDSARAEFAMVLDSAARRAAESGVDSLSGIERAALRANYPDGIPGSIARELGIPADNPNFVVRLGDETMAAAAGGKPAVPATPPAAPRVAPETSSNPLLRKLYDENLATARLGTPEAQGRLAQIERAAAEWEQLPADARGRVTEAMETFNRLRRENPALAQLNEAGAAEYFNLHARRMNYSQSANVRRPVVPEELVAEFAQQHGVPVSPQQLASAANISELNAEGAIFGAKQRFPDMPEGAAASAPPATPGAGTAVPPPAPAPHVTPTTPRETEIADLLRRMGMKEREAAVAAIVPGVRDGSTRAGAAHAAMQSGIPARRVQEALGVNPAALRAELDGYLRRFDPAGEAERARLLDNYFGETPTLIEPRNLPDLPGTEPNLPRGLAPPAVSREAAREKVLAALDRMGIPRANAEALTPSDIFPRGTAPDAMEGTARMANLLDVPAPRAARALGISETDYAGLLDRAEGLAQPHLTPSRRAATVAEELGADGVTQPFRRVLDARQHQVDAALRDLGIPQGDPALSRAGLDTESAIVGQALENGVPAADIAARRGLTPGRVQELADDFLRDGRNVTDAAERGHRRTLLLQESPLEPGPDASTVRLPPRVLAMQDEVAAALERLSIDPVIAGERAGQLANVARRDAHEAIIAGAWQSRISPAQLREQFGYSDALIARALDSYLGNTGLRDAAVRAQLIMGYFSRHGQQLDPAALRGMIAGAPSPPPPLRAVAVRPSGPVAPPPSSLAPSPGTSLDGQFGPAIAPRYFRDGELTASGAIRPNAAAAEVRPGTPLRLEPDLWYNWLINDEGRLVFGPEQFIFENGRPVVDSSGMPLRMGHPAMINGGRARIAGELRHIDGRGWVLNNISGRYSMGRPELNRQHLANVAAIFEQAGVRVQLDYR